MQWLGTTEMIQGRFHEPAFYGQAYNTLFEAFLAIPLTAAGLPVYVALPIVAALLAVFPFILLSLCALKRNQNAALLFLVIPLVLPNEYVLLTQLPRGFVAGVFMATIAVALLVFSEKPTTARLFFSGFFGAFSLVLNPNGVLLLIPVYLLLLFASEKKWQTVVWLLAGALPGIIVQGVIIYFYAKRPYYLAHGYSEVVPSLQSFVKAFSRFHELFYGLFPFVYFAGAAIIPTLGYIIYRLYKNGQKKHALAFLCTLLFLFTTFITGKMTDGTTSVFFPYARMHLALPVLAGLGFYFIGKQKNTLFSLKHWRWPLTAVLLFACIKLAAINDRIGWNLHNNSGYVSVFKIDDLKQRYKKIETCADTLGINTLIFSGKNDEYNYGLMALSNGKLRTLSLGCERKKWLMLAIEQEKIGRFLLWCENKKLAALPGLTASRLAGPFPLYRASTPQNPLTFFRLRRVFKPGYELATRKPGEVF